MKILPQQKLTLVTQLSKVEIIEQLNLITLQRQNVNFSKQKTESGKKFEGYIYSDSFKIVRIINYKNSFRPEITGKLIEKEQNTEIELELKTVSIVTIFMMIWLGGVTFAFITTLIGGIIGKSQIEICFFPLIMLIFGFSLFHIGFSTENEKSKKEIIEILKAKLKNGS